MRKPTLHRLVVVFVAVAAWFVAACGGPSQDVASARAARYKGDPNAMFNAALAAVQANYKIAQGDQKAMGFRTIARWYAPDGSVAAEDGADMRVVPNNSLSIAWNVVFRPDGDAYFVDVKPLMIRYIAGSPKPQPVDENDPYVPGWFSERRDKLASDIHDALKQWEVPMVPGNPPAAPAPAASSASPATPATPAQPSSTPPAAPAAPATPAQ